MAEPAGERRRKVKTTLVVAVVCALALTVGQAGAAVAPIDMSLADLEVNGWKVTVKDGPEAGASVSERLQDGSEGFQFSPKRSVNDGRSWAGISTANYAEKKANQITTLNIRTYGLEGDGSNWQPPSFHLVFQKAPDNPSRREAVWLPWVNQPRLPGQWNEYDALTTGQWYIPWIGARYATYADMLAAYPDMMLVTDATAAAWDVPSGQSFNVGSASLYNEMNQYYSSARGTVDWIDVGIDGEVTRFDFKMRVLPTVVMRGANALEPIMNNAKGNFKFTMYGKIIDSDYYSYVTIDDGSNRTIKVTATDFVGAPGAFIRATGRLNNLADPPTLASSPADIEVLADPIIP